MKEEGEARPPGRLSRAVPDLRSNVRQSLADLVSLAHTIEERAQDLIGRVINDAEFHRTAIDEAAIVAVTDTRGTILYVNGKFCEISGYTEAELIGQNHRILRSGLHDRAFWREVYRTIARGQIWRGELCNRSKWGDLYWVHTTIVPQRSVSGRILGYTSIRFDITAEKNAESRLWKLANLDGLTGLPNRRWFRELLDERLSRPDAIDPGVALGLFDLDNFKDVNDAYGHETGDELLMSVAGIVGAMLGPDDLLARLGGDEFGILLARTSSEKQARLRFEAILEALRRPVKVAAGRIPLHSSLGFAGCPTDGTDRVNLWQNADIALFEAKNNGRDQAIAFSAEMREEVARLAELRARIHDGLSQEEFLVYYQPILSIRTGRVIKLEALVRWRHPKLGLITAGQFHEAFSSGAIAAAIGQFVLQRVIQQMAEWRAAGLDVPCVSVNSATGDLTSPAFVDRLLGAIETGLIGPTDISVEITEGMLLSKGATHVQRELERLGEAGIEVLFDDFGTGHASLTHLRETPISTIKLSREFVSDIETSPRDRALMGHVVALAHSLGLKVTAEGVETETQRAILAGMECDNIQGYLLSPAVPADEVMPLIARLETARQLADGRPRQVLPIETALAIAR